MFRTRNAPLALALLVPLAATTVHGQSCSCEVSDRKEAAYDWLLLLDTEESAAAESWHMPFGVPAGVTANEHILDQDDYIINYDSDLRVPLWVAYRLRDFDLRIDRPRIQCFRRDLRVADAEAGVCTDYEEPVFDRGHMAPNADFVRSEAAMINTYILSNMTPQYANFNRSIWARLEGYVRDWARLKGEIFVITGAVFDRDNDGTRDADDQAQRMQSNNGNTRVAVPSHFYKIILAPRHDLFWETISFLLPHQQQTPNNDTTLTNAIVSIKEIEALTGIDFLTAIAAQDANREQAIESFTATALWQH
jgi:endonuclease G